METHDVERLAAFVVATREDLGFIFDTAERELSRPVAEYLRPAWRALEDRDEFGQLLRALRSRDYDDRLERAGLSGPELDLKLAALEDARRQAQTRPTGRKLKRWLRWINIIFGSLVAATGLGEGIKELKEAVEADLEPTDRRRR